MGARSGAVIALLADTHVFAWVLRDPAKLSDIAVEMLSSTPDVRLSAVSLYEITYKVRVGKWPEMERAAQNVRRIAEDRLYRISPCDAEVMQTAGSLDWAHRDPFDRMIAATALVLDLPLLSADTAFDTAPIPIRRIW